MSRRLTGSVALRDPATHAPVVFTAGDDVPGWATDLITNEALWEDDDAPFGVDPGSLMILPDAQPPRAGPGSSRDAWALHADLIGAEYPEGASRDEIIAVVDEFNG